MTDLNIASITGELSGGVSMLSSAMGDLGIGETSDATQALVQSLSLMSGIAQMAGAAAAVMAVRNASETAALAAQVSAMSVNPFSWPMLIAGLAAGATAAAFVYSLTREYTIRADLSTESGILSTVTQVGALI